MRAMRKCARMHSRMRAHANTLKNTHTCMHAQVEALKLALVQSKVETDEEQEFLRKSSLYAGAKDLAHNVPVERR